MRTYHDAKAMAKSLRDSLAAKSISLSHSACLEVVAKQWGFADWNTLSAKLNAEPGPGVHSAFDSAPFPVIPRGNHHMSRVAGHAQMFCSFCDKSQHDVRILIEGGCRNPALSQCVFICDECIGLSAEVIADRMGDGASPKSPAAL